MKREITLQEGDVLYMKCVSNGNNEHYSIYEIKIDDDTVDGEGVDSFLETFSGDEEDDL